MPPRRGTPLAERQRNTHPLKVMRPNLDDVRRALALTDFDAVSAWRQMAPQHRRLESLPAADGAARTAAVLLLLYPQGGQLVFVLTRRTEIVATHKGQISLPGGAQESGESPAQTAIRETCEEIGVCQADISLIGALTPLYVGVSGFQINPFVGYLPARPQISPDPVEVAETLEVPLSQLLDDSVKQVERWHLGGMDLDVPFYRISGYPVWGATAIILSEMEHRLRAALALSL